MTSFPTLRPSEEDVAGRLHEPEAVHHTLSVVRVDALSRKVLQDRGARFLDLKNEGLASSGHQQEHLAGGADAPDADDLDRGVHHLVMVKQHTMAWRHGFAVLVEGLLNFKVDLPGGVTFPVEDCRELVLEVRRPACVVYELREEAFGGAALSRLRQALDGAAADHGILNLRDQHVGLEGEVPEVQDFHFAELGHVFAVGPDAAKGPHPWRRIR